MQNQPLNLRLRIAIFFIFGAVSSTTDCQQSPIPPNAATYEMLIARNAMNITDEVKEFSNKTKLYKKRRSCELDSAPMSTRFSFFQV